MNEQEDKMLKIEEILNPEDLSKYQEIEAKLISGEIKRSTLPNTGKEFNSEEALKRFKAFLATGINKNYMRGLDDRI